MFSFLGLKTSTVVSVFAVLPLLIIFLAPILVSRLGRFLGFTLRKKTEGRRLQLVAFMNEEDEAYRKANSGPEKASLGEEKASGQTVDNWDGVIGFFHPFW